MSVCVRVLWRYKYKPKQKKKLYSVTSRTNLTKAGMSTNSLASTMPDANGIKVGDNSTATTTTPNGREEGFTNDGFLEMTERLWLDSGFSLQVTQQLWLGTGFLLETTEGLWLDSGFSLQVTQQLWLGTGFRLETTERLWLEGGFVWRPENGYDWWGQCWRWMEQRPNTVGDPSKNAQIKCLTKPKETVPLAVFRFFY